jgi:hypothetical protein
LKDNPCASANVNAGREMKIESH